MLVVCSSRAREARGKKVLFCIAENGAQGPGHCPQCPESSEMPPGLHCGHSGHCVYSVVLDVGQAVTTRRQLPARSARSGRAVVGMPVVGCAVCISEWPQRALALPRAAEIINDAACTGQLRQHRDKLSLCCWIGQTSQKAASRSLHTVTDRSRE